MNLEKLKIIMENSGVNRFSYCINSKKMKDDAYHIRFENGIWDVFYMEREKKSMFGSFISEEEACKCYLEIVQKDLGIKL